MEIFLTILGIVLLVVVGNALILLRTAKKPKIPKSIQSQPDSDDEQGW